MDSALSSIPFFAAGYMAFRKTSILKPNKYDKYLPFIILLAFIFVYVFCTYYSLMKNSFTLRAAIVFYPCGLLGTYGVVMLAKFLKKLPLISYLGRYSIMILVSHLEVIRLYKTVLRHTGLDLPPQYLLLINLILTLLSYLIIIPFMRKFMPHVTAQKDLIPIWFINHHLLLPSINRTQKLWRNLTGKTTNAPTGTSDSNYGAYKQIICPDLTKSEEICPCEYPRAKI